MKDRTLLMIPGPIEFEPEVLAALGAPTTSHVAPGLRRGVRAGAGAHAPGLPLPDGQPFVVAGSGTLAMELAGANLIEPGDRALVVNTGYFGDRFGDAPGALRRAGDARARARRRAPTLDRGRGRAARGRYKLMTVTHVDTSTGVLTDVQALAALARRYGALSVVDGVCSVAGGAAHGRVGRRRGADRLAEGDRRAAGAGAAGRESARAGGFPAAPDAGAELLRRLGELAADHGGLRSAQAELLRHAGGEPGVGTQRQPGPDPGGRDGSALRAPPGAGRGVPGRRSRRSGWARCRWRPRPRQHHDGAALSAGVTGAELLARVKAAAGVILAGGLHPAIRAEYFRIGHMGPTTLGDVLATIGAIETGCGSAATGLPQAQESRQRRRRTRRKRF